MCLGRQERCKAIGGVFRKDVEKKLKNARRYAKCYVQEVEMLLLIGKHGEEKRETSQRFGISCSSRGCLPEGAASHDGTSRMTKW